MTGPAARATWTLAVALTIAALTGCTSGPAPPRPSTAAPLDGIRRVVVIASGESRFAVVRGSDEPGRVFDEVMKWLPYKDVLVPIAQAVYSMITSLMEADRASSTTPRDVTPAAVVAEAFAATLRRAGSFDEVAATKREPVGDERRGADAIVRLTVPSWGLVQVRGGDPELVGGFADVSAEMVLRETGVVVWKHAEDVTHPEPISLASFTADRALTRERMIEVLERAGRRLANELVYARSGDQ